MEFEASLTDVIIIAASACAVWLCLPDALFLLGLSRIRSGVVCGPEDVRFESAGILTEEIDRQLDALGFVPAGVYWEQMPAHKSFREVVFVARTGDCFAAVYRLFNNDPPRVAFKTVFRGAAFVFTQNYTGGMEAHEETLWAGGLALDETAAAAEPDARRIEQRLPLERVLREHEQRVRSFLWTGHVPAPASSVDDYAEADRVYMDHPTVRREFRNSVALLSLLKAGLLAAGPALAVLLGAGRDVVGAVLLAESLGMLVFRYYGYPLLAALDKMLPARTPN
jgi:hypothetical protein